MAHSVEARVPFMDHPLAELAARMPPQLKLNGLNEKYILKKCIGARLPPLPHEYKKRGFYTPISEWFFTPQRYAELEPYLGPEALRRCGLFAPAAVQKLHDNLRSLGEPTDMNSNFRLMQLEWVLFTVLSVQILHHLFVERQAPCFAHAPDHGRSPASLNV